MRIKFDKGPLAVEQRNYLTKVVNAYIVPGLDAWPKVSLRSFIFKNCLFGTTTIVKNNNKEKWVYSGYEIVFDGKGEWSFGQKYAVNGVIFDVDSSLSSHIDNHKNIFLVLSVNDTFGINGTFVAPEKKFSINFSKEKTRFSLTLHYNGDISYLFVNINLYV